MKPPAFQFYPDAWLSSLRVQLMTLEEEGAYIRLLSFCWRHGSIPADPEKAARLIGKGASTTVAETVLKMFTTLPDGIHMTHDRLEEEREKQRIWREKSSEGGKKSAKLRTKSKGGSTTLPTTLPTKRQPASLPNGINQNSTLLSPSLSLVSDSLLEESLSPVATGNHQAFIKGWCDNFLQAHGVSYHVDGGKDGKAVKELMGRGIPIVDLLEIAKNAWAREKTDQFCRACKNASTIMGFKVHLNEINVELSRPALRKPNPRVGQNI